MYPYIYFPGREIPMYGVCAAIGALFAVVAFKLKEKRLFGATGADTELAFIYGLIGALIGAKALYLLQALPDILAELPQIAEHPARFFVQYFLSGFVFYGGMYGAIAGVWLYCALSHVDFERCALPLVPSVPLFHAFGRLGCFCMGCCYGRETAVAALGVRFSESPIAPNGVELLPVQLYEAGLEAALFVLLYALAGRRLNARKCLAVYLLVYGAARFFLEFLRGDAYRGFVGALSVSQVISLATVALAAVALKWAKAVERR